MDKEKPLHEDTNSTTGGTSINRIVDSFHCTNMSSPGDSERQSHAHARTPSTPHIPIVPSQLRNVQVPSEASSPEDSFKQQRPDAEAGAEPEEGRLEISATGIEPSTDAASVHSNNANIKSHDTGFHIDLESTVRSRLLNHQNWDAASGCGDADCNHGATSPRPWSHRSYGSMMDTGGFGGRYPDSVNGRTGEPADATHALLGDAVTDGLLGGGKGPKRSTTMHLAKTHGVKHTKMMYV